jgi:hypothetical protein
MNKKNTVYTITTLKVCLFHTFSVFPFLDVFLCFNPFSPPLQVYV